MCPGGPSGNFKVCVLEKGADVEEHDSFADCWPLLCQGDGEAARVVFERFRARLLSLASAQFETWIRDRADPEGVLQSIFRSFFCRTRGSI